MSDFVLSVWMAGDIPDDGRAPIRLCPAGSTESVAEHNTGFDVSPFEHDGVVVEPEQCLTRHGLLDQPRKAAVGDALWARLTPGTIGTELGRLIGTSRIYLDLRSDGLQTYPWELLRHDDRYLGSSPNAQLLLGRPDRGPAGLAGTPPPLDHPLRLLVVIGNRHDDTNIRAAEELLLIEREARLRNAEVLLTTLPRPPGPGRSETGLSGTVIQDALTTFRPHIVHFIGHGGQAPPVAPGAAPGPVRFFVHSRTSDIDDPWDAHRVWSVFSAAPPRVVVLNACLTAVSPTRATSLVSAFLDAGCLAVVGMMGEIRGLASETFSRQFYAQLFGGAPIDRAVNRARQAIAELDDAAAGQLLQEPRSNWALPRLTVRGDAGAAVGMVHPHQQPQWLADDFVGRWDERWQAWEAMTGSRQAVAAIESRLVVLHGGPDSGKRELMNTLAAIRWRAGDAVLLVDLSSGRTGGWRDLLRRIAAQAAKDGFDAQELQAAASARGGSRTVIEGFRLALEKLSPPGGGTEPILVILDGLARWDVDIVRDTVLPELCRPFLSAAGSSRVRMMLSLEGAPDGRAWGARPAGWEPIVVDQFDTEEWRRDLAHFRDFWLPRVRAQMQPSFANLVTAMTGLPVASNLAHLRQLAETYR